MRNHRFTRALVIGLVLLFAIPSPAAAWQVMSHQVVAVRAAEQMAGNDDLKAILLGNEVYLRAGAMGPDIFYMSARAGYSDLAHYCRTDELAEAMLDLAEKRSDRARAFAYGWFSHNIADSVAHPWVNGFTGHPYVDFPRRSREPDAHGDRRMGEQEDRVRGAAGPRTAGEPGPGGI